MKSVKVTDMNTKEFFVFKTLEDAANKTNLHRSKFIRRFKKSDTFYLENFFVERALFL